MAETTAVIGKLPYVETGMLDDEVYGEVTEQPKLRPNFGYPRCGSITIDTALAMRMFQWPWLRLRVLFALLMQTRPLTYAQVTTHATVTEDGCAIPDDDAMSGRCRYTIPTGPMVANNAMPENLLRLITPDTSWVVHKLRLLVAEAGFEIDPAVFDHEPALPKPTLENIAHELAALQAEGIVGPLDPAGKVQLNGRLLFNGNPALRTLLPEMVKPAPGDIFSVNPAHAVDPYKEPPEGCFKSGKRKAQSIAGERRKWQACQREIEHDEETIARLHAQKIQAEHKLDKITEIALDEALRRQAAEARAAELELENAELQAMHARVESTCEGQPCNGHSDAEQASQEVQA